MQYFLLTFFLLLQNISEKQSGKSRKLHGMKSMTINFFNRQKYRLVHTENICRQQFQCDSADEVCPS